LAAVAVLVAVVVLCDERGRRRADVLVSCGVLSGETVPSAPREPRERDTDVTATVVPMGWW